MKTLVRISLVLTGLVISASALAIPEMYPTAEELRLKNAAAEINARVKEDCTALKLERRQVRKVMNNYLSFQTDGSERSELNKADMIEDSRDQVEAINMKLKELNCPLF